MRLVPTLFRRLGQHHLAVITPEIQKRISEVVGYKLTRANSLHGIGAALFFRWMFPIANSNEERASYVVVMAGSETDLLDLNKVRKEIAALRVSLDEYRTVVQRLVSDNEIMTFSDQARQDTLFETTESRKAIS